LLKKFQKCLNSYYKHSALPKIATVTFNAVEEFLVFCSCKPIIVLLGTGGKQADTPSAVCHTRDCFQHVIQIHV